MESLIEKHHQRLSLTDTRFVRSLKDRIQWDSRLVGIKGARGVGKTTLMLQYILQNYGQDNIALYVSLDNIWFADHKLSTLADDFVKHGGRHLFLDEVHKYPSWSQEIKNIYDDYSQSENCIHRLSLLDILNARVDLSRRADIYTCRGSLSVNMQLCFRYQSAGLWSAGYLGHHIEISAEVVGKFKPIRYFGDYLQNGYYPYYSENPGRYPMRLEETVNMILEIELPLLRGVEYGYIHKLKQLLQIISQSAPFVPNVSKLAERTGMARITLVSYLKYLEEAKLITALYKNSAGISFSKSLKRYFLRI
jgi:predicted AAA+ superfamily ATPase